MEAWAKFEGKLRSLPTTSKKSRTLSRFFLAGAVEAELDKQGRALLPAPLREHAGLIKDVVLVGVGGKVEIWSAENWQAVSAPENIEDIAEELSEELSGMGLDL